MYIHFVLILNAFGFGVLTGTSLFSVRLYYKPLFDT
nr:MAG TPA_asm: hypothetical protein [Caudoviricetes sp.]